MLNVFIVSGHDAAAPRKASLHFLMENLSRRKINVDFMTVGVSPFKFLKRSGYRFLPPFNTWAEVKPYVNKYVWFPPFHPFSLRNSLLNYAVWPLHTLYPFMLPASVVERIRKADVVVIESGIGLLLVQRIAALAPKAKMVYSVSDRLVTLSFHPIVTAREKRDLHYFDLIRVTASVMKSDFPDSAPVEYIPQGLDRDVFDQDVASPYTSPKNAISVGDMLFDAPIIEKLAKSFPDWTFHLFGRGAKTSKKYPNIIEHGEQPFATLMPYIKHADIGIAPYRASPRADYLSQSSLKMIQYTYCKLPIVAPDFVAAGRPHVLPFDSKAKDDHSLVNAFGLAIDYNRESIDFSSVLNWDEVADRIIETVEGKTSVGFTPPFILPLHLPDCETLPVS
jgi:2-beta-glucuronyltransferase